MNIGTEDLKRRLVRTFSENSTGRGIADLIAGNLISQIVIFAALPVITRVYSPEDMNLLAIYVALLTMIAVVTCLRLEIAIPIPENAAVAVNLAMLSVIFSMMVTVVITVLLIAVWIADFQYLTAHDLWRYAWLLPLGALFVGFYATAQFWSTRMARYSLLGRTKVYQALVGAGTQIIAGLLGIVPLGLLLGHLLMSGAGFFNLFRAAWKNERHLISEISWARMRGAFVDHKNFPKFSIIEGLATNGAQQVTIILIAVFSVGAEAGFFFVAVRALNAPIALVTNAVSQVYYQRAPEHFRKGTLRQFTRNILGAIAVVFIPPLLVLAYFSQPTFSFVFGADWARTGEMIVILMPMLILSLFSASIGMVMNVTGQQGHMMQLKLLGFALRVGGVLFAGLVFPEYLVEVYAVASLGVFGIYLTVFYRASGLTLRNENV